MNVRELKDNSGVVFSPKVSADSVYLTGSTTTLTTKLGTIPTKVSQLDNDSGYLTSLPSHTHPQDNNFIYHGNEFNFVPTLHENTEVCFNYRQSGGNNSSGYIIGAYRFCSGTPSLST